MRYRNLLLKVFSLGVGIAISFVLIAKVCFESSYDSFYKDIDRTYLILSGIEKGTDRAEYGQVSGAIAPGMKKYVPGVESATRTTFYFGSEKFILKDKSVVTGKSVLADSCFFDVFDRKILAGDPHHVLGSVVNIMVSESFAKKLGGIDKAVGQQIANEEAPHLKLTVGGVFEDFPKNGSLDYDILISLVSYPKASTENWIGNDRYLGYVKLQKNVLASSLKDAIRRMQIDHQPNILNLEKQAGGRLWYRLTPLSELHSSDPQVHSIILILSVVSLILLVISLMNYGLTTVSEMMQRAKEMCIHKCYGAEAWDIYKLLFKETGITLLLALALAALLTIAAEPFIEDLMGVKLIALLIPQTMMVLSIVTIALFLISIIIPGYLFNHVPVGIVFRHYVQNKRYWKLTLLTVQFVINVFMVSFVIVITAQYNQVLHHDPGYNYDNIYYFYTKGIKSAQIALAVDKLNAMPEVTAVAKCTDLPFDDSSGNNIGLPGQYSELFNIADQYWGSEGFFDFFGIQLKEGREPKVGNEVAVSENFVKKMNEFADWSDGAIGKEILITEHSANFETAFTVTGVYKDYLIGVLNGADVRPSIRFTAEMKENLLMCYTLVKLKEDTPENFTKVKEAIQSCVDDRDIELLSYREEFVKLYDESKKMRNTLVVGCIFTLVIAFLGLVSYIMDEALRRSKEIAIRKINGATTSEIIGLFLKDILKLLGIAIIVGNATAYYIFDLWMELFASKIAFQFSYFLVADFLVAAIIVTVVVLYGLKISRANPVVSLKNE